MLTTTVGYVVYCLEIQMNRNIGLDMKLVMHGFMVTVLASHQKMSLINFIVLVYNVSFCVCVCVCIIKNMNIIVANIICIIIMFIVH